MKTLVLVAVAAVSIGATLALSGCSACSPQSGDTATKKPKPAVTCGPGTVPQGNTCVGK